MVECFCEAFCEALHTVDYLTKTFSCVAAVQLGQVSLLSMDIVNSVYNDPGSTITTLVFPIPSSNLDSSTPMLVEYSQEYTFESDTTAEFTNSFTKATTTSHTLTRSFTLGVKDVSQAAVGAWHLVHAFGYECVTCFILVFLLLIFYCCMFSSTF